MPTYYLVSDPRGSVNDEFRPEYEHTDNPSKANIERIFEAIQNSGYSCTQFGGVYSLIDAISTGYRFPNDATILNFSDGLSQSYSRVQVPVLCEVLGINYSGTGVFGSALMNNKYCTNLVLQKEEIKSPSSLRATKHYIPEVGDIEQLLPAFIKPNAEGSSLGITQDSLQENVDGVIGQIGKLLTQFDEVIVEEYIAGSDITVFLIGNEGTFLCDEAICITSDNSEFLTGDLKANRQVQRELAANVIGNDLCETIHAQSKRAFRALGCRDYARFDFRVTENSQIYFIEANSCPRISPTSELGFIALMNHTSFDFYVGLLIRVIEERIKKEQTFQS